MQNPRGRALTSHLEACLGHVARTRAGRYCMYPCAGRTACNDAPMCYPCAAIHVERHGYTVTMKLHVEVSRLVSLGVGNVPSTRGSRYTFWASS